MEPLALTRLLGAPPGRFAAPTMDDVGRHNRRGVQADLAGNQVDLLVVVVLEIDDAVAAETGDGHPVPRVERNQPIARRHIADAGGATVAPVGDAAPGELTRRRFTALALVLAVHPQQLARLAVERDDGAP